MSKSPFFRKSLIGTACFGVVAGLGFVLGAAIRPVAVEAQSPTPASSMPSSSMPGSSMGSGDPSGASSSGAGTSSAPVAVGAPTAPYVDVAPNVGTVGIAPAPDFVAPPFVLPITFLRDPRYGFARDLLKQNGVPLESILDPLSTAHPSALVERLISLSNLEPKAMAQNLGVLNEILGRAKREIGGDAKYKRKLTYLQEAVSALQVGANQAAGPATPAQGQATGGDIRGGATSGSGAASTGAKNAISGVYISQARLNGRLADTLMPSPFQPTF